MEHSANEPESQPAGENDPPAQAQRPARRRGWRQFSLFSLLLLFVIACLIAGYVGQTRRMEQARREIAQRDEAIRRLRQELGIDEEAESALTIQDPAKLHVAALPSFEENAWRWKVYLPPGKAWKVGFEVLESPGAGEPLGFVSGSLSHADDDGELVLEARLLRDLEGFPRVTTRLGRGGSGHGSSYLESQFKAKGSVSIRQAGRPEQVVAGPGERIDVLRRIVFREPNDKGIAHEERGLVIYLEEDQPSAGAKKLRESFPK